MSFAWPLALLALAAVPLLLAVHWWQQRRRRRAAVRYPSVALLRVAGAGRSGWRRHVPLALLLGAVGLLGIAVARPQAEVTVATARTTIMLALDVSGSMCATDVDPNRLSVAQAAAREFVLAQPDGMRIGIVAFAGSAQTLVPPTQDRDALAAAIDSLTTSRGTAIGAAILQSIESIAEINPAVAPLDEAVADPADPPAAPVTEGDYVADIVVLLTDGSNTRGIEPLDAVPFAVDRRVRVYTIGFGTDSPQGMSCTAEQLGGRGFDTGGGFGGGGGRGGGGRGGFLLIDEPTLQAVADLTGGTYHPAEDAQQLTEVFAGLPREIGEQTEQREITSWFAIAAGLLAAGGIVVSFRRSMRSA